MIRSARAMLLLLLPLSAALAAEPQAQQLDEQGDPLPAHALARLGSTRWRQQWSVVDLSYSTDGKLLAARSYEEGFCLWDAASGKRLFKLPLEESSQWFTACSGDARVVALANQRGKKVELRDSRNGKLLDEYEVQGPARMALSADGSLLAVQTWDSEQSMIHLWDRGQAALVRKWKCEASQLQFSPDGKTLVTGDRHRLRIWDAATGKERRRIEVGAALFALSLDGRTLAVRENGGVRLLDFASGQERRRLAVVDAELDTRYDRLALSADGAVVALAGNGFVFAWDTANGQERFRRIGNFWANTVTFSPSSAVLTWGCMYDPAIHRWDLQKGQLVSPGHESWVQSVAFSPDSQTLASGSTDRTVRFWDLKPAKGPVKPVLPTGESRTLSLILGGRMAWSADGKRLAVLGPGNIRLIDPASGKVVQTLACSSPCYCLAFSPDGTLLAGGDSYHGKASNPQGRVSIWEVSSGKQIQLLEGHGDTVRSVAFAPDGKTLASGSDGVRLWDVATAKQVGRFRHGRFIDAIAFTPDSKMLSAGGESAVLWDVASGKELHRLPGTGNVPALAISSDGKLLATGGLDHMVRLWDVASGKELIQLPGHTGRVHAVAFSPDSRRLASGSEDTTILLWDVIGALIAARTKAKPIQPLANLDTLWADLAGADAPAGHKAVWELANEPQRSLPFLKDRLQPVPEDGAEGLVVPAGELLRLIRAVEVLERIGTNEARAILEKLAGGPVSRSSREAAAALLRLDRLKASMPGSSRQDGPNDRLEQLWKLLGAADAAAGHQASWALVGEPEQTLALFQCRLKPAAKAEEADTILVPAGDALRAYRAVAVLERIGTAEARAILETLAQGASSRVTAEAKAALDRLERRTKGKP